MDDKNLQAIAESIPSELLTPECQYNHFNKKKYAASFAQYNKEFLVAVSGLLEVALAEGELLAFGRMLGARITSLMPAKTRVSSTLFAATAMFIVTYVFPSLLKISGVDGQVIIGGIQEKWTERFPKQSLKFATFEQIDSSFPKSLLQRLQGS